MVIPNLSKICYLIASSDVLHGVTHRKYIHVPVIRQMQKKYHPYIRIALAAFMLNSSSILLYAQINSKKCYFFKGKEYIRFDIKRDQIDEDYPKHIKGNWINIWEKDIDAAINWGNGKVYFFKGKQYIRHDLKADQADPNYPKSISKHWPGLWADEIDAAINWGNGKAYFFKGNQYIRYDIIKDKSDPGYPKKISISWPGFWVEGIDAAINYGNNKAYFFKGDQYIRFDIEKDCMDPGYPKYIKKYWSGLWSEIDACVLWDTLIEQNLNGGKIRDRVYRIAVVEFSELGNLNYTQAGTIVAEWLSVSLEKIDAFEVYERISIDKLTEEYKLQQTGFIDEDTMAKIGKMHGVEAIVIGSITKLGSTITITAKLVNTETAKLIDSVVCNVSTIDELSGKIDKIALDLARTP